MAKVCKKCGYERQLLDTAPEYECPKCKAIYAKVEEYLEKKKLEEEKIKTALEKMGRPDSQKLLKSHNENKKANHIIVKTYEGTQSTANALFRVDTANMAAANYFPISQSWAPGSYGCGSFLVALALCFIFVGFIVFISVHDKNYSVL
jgi:hypothetical protein